MGLEGSLLPWAPALEVVGHPASQRQGPVCSLQVPLPQESLQCRAQVVLSPQGGHRAGGEGTPGSQGLGLFPPGLPGPHPDPHRGCGESEGVPSPSPPQAASPDIHLMGAEAQVGVQDEAGGEVVVLTQFPGCHSVGPHGAPWTMLPPTENGEHKAAAGAVPWACACSTPLISCAGLCQYLPSHL